METRSISTRRFCLPSGNESWPGKPRSPTTTDAACILEAAPQRIEGVAALFLRSGPPPPQCSCKSPALSAAKEPVDSVRAAVSAPRMRGALRCWKLRFQPPPCIQMHSLVTVVVHRRFGFASWTVAVRRSANRRTPHTLVFASIRPCYVSTIDLRVGAPLFHAPFPVWAVTAGLVICTGHIHELQLRASSVCVLYTLPSAGDCPAAIELAIPAASRPNHLCSWEAQTSWPTGILFPKGKPQPLV